MSEKGDTKGHEKGDRKGDQEALLEFSELTAAELGLLEDDPSPVAVYFARCLCEARRRLPDPGHFTPERR